MALSSSLRKVASKVIGKFGGDVTVRIVTAGSYNISEGTIAHSESDTTVKGVLEDVTLNLGIRLTEVNQQIQNNDKKLTIAASAINTAPTLKDKIVISGVIYEIAELKTLEQANVAIAYELIIRA